MRRDKHVVAIGLRYREDPLHVLDCAVLGNAGADRSPVHPLLAQHIVLRVDKDDCGVGVADVHGLLLRSPIPLCAATESLAKKIFLSAKRGVTDRPEAMRVFVTAVSTIIMSHEAP